MIETELQLLTVPEVAAVLAVHPKTVRRLVASGELIAVKIGAAVRVRWTDIDAFVEEHRTGRSVRTRAPRARSQATASSSSFSDRLRLVDRERAQS